MVNGWLTLSAFSVCAPLISSIWITGASAAIVKVCSPLLTLPAASVMVIWAVCCPCSSWLISAGVNGALHFPSLEIAPIIVVPLMVTSTLLPGAASVVPLRICTSDCSWAFSTLSAVRLSTVRAGPTLLIVTLPVVVVSLPALSLTVTVMAFGP